MRLHIDCILVYACSQPTPMLLILEPMYHSQQKVLDNKRTITPTTVIEEYLDSYGNKVWRILAPAGNV